MRILTLITIGILLTTLTGRAEETLATLKVGSDIYTHVTITSVTPTDIVFSSDQGVANAKLKNLDPELQKHFHYDGTKANAAAQKQKELAALYASLSASNILETIVKTNAQTLMNAAVAKAKAIINQPVAAYPVNRTMTTSQIIGDAWFHPGATTPDFNSVDIRKTQDLHYAKDGKDVFITCSQNPGLAFLGTDLEFNPMTKFFYVDRSVPKKKLTEAEMLQINHLYRLIAKCEQQGATLPH